MGLHRVRYDETPSTIPPQLVRAGDLVFVGGQMAAHPVFGMPEEARLVPNYPWHGSSIEKQLVYLYGKLDSALGQVNSSLRDILKINSYHVNPAEIDMALRVRKNWFGESDPPPSTLVLCDELPIKGPTVLIDMVALAKDAERPRTPVKITKSPSISHVAALGWAAYIRACKGGGFIFTAGKAASRDRGPIKEAVRDPQFPYRHNQIRVQTEYVLNELKIVLDESGCSLDDIVRAEVHLADITDLAVFEEVWRSVFPVDPPARVIVPLDLPTPSLIVEVEFICVDPQGPYRRNVISAPDVPSPIGHEPQAIQAGPFLFLSGQLASDSTADGLAPAARVPQGLSYYSSPIRRQTEYILDNVRKICEEAGTSIDNLVKRRVHYLDLESMPEADHVWEEQVGSDLPPTSAFRTHSDLPVPGCRVQYDLIAYIP